jgi:hypothetical protein
MISVSRSIARRRRSSSSPSPASGRVSTSGTTSLGPRVPDRERRGYALSQLFSSIVDPADILHDYRTTRFPERFYTLKVGIPWADRENRLRVDDVFRLCSDRDLLMRSMGPCSMGVDTGRELHDLSRREVREGVIVLPRRLPIVETFALHLTRDAKQLTEDPETGTARYRYLKTGVNHFSLAFTYEALAAARWGPPVDVPIAIS